ncbi:MAG: LPS assembly lipoprotein LptE [Luteimonas sp.]
MKITHRVPLRLRRFVAIASTAVLTVALSACGFHLRDALALPTDLGPVRVVASDPYSPLAQSLAEALLRAGATPAPENSGNEVATLQILSERFADTSISVDQFGRSQEFSLRYAVIFILRKAGNTGDIVPKQAIELSRDYVASPSDSLGKNSERELLTRELRREMTQAVLRRIDAASRLPTP